MVQHLKTDIYTLLYLNNQEKKYTYDIYEQSYNKL